MEDTKYEGYDEEKLLPFFQEMEFKSLLERMGMEEQQLEKLVKSGPDGRAQAQTAVDKWYVVGLDMFGKSGSARTERYLEWGLKRRTNEEARRQYIAEMEPKIAALGLVVPDRLQGRKYL